MSRGLSRNSLGQPLERYGSFKDTCQVSDRDLSRQARMGRQFNPSPEKATDCGDRWLSVYEDVGAHGFSETSMLHCLSRRSHPSFALRGYGGQAFGRRRIGRWMLDVRIYSCPDKRPFESRSLLRAPRVIPVDYPQINRRMKP